MKPERDLLIRYILGECDAHECRKVESAYFADRVLLRQLNGLTEEMVNAYVANSMSPVLRKRFERCLELKPHIKKRVDRAAKK
jgi:hypothetical protein